MTVELELDKLQKLAETQIMANINEENALEEVLSGFSSLFEDIRKKQARYLRSNWSYIKNKKSTETLWKEHPTDSLWLELMRGTSPSSRW